VIPVLAQYGITEADVRAHSLAWLTQTWSALDRHRGEVFRAQMAAQIQAVCLGTVGAYSEEGQVQMREAVEELTRPLEPLVTPGNGALPYELDPSAKPDEAALAVLATGKFPGTPMGDNTCGIGFKRMRKEDWERGAIQA
jgi:hypothetical protein